jgi:hypothetical protein
VIQINNHLYCILSERLLLFSINSFSNDLIVEILDYLYEWNLLEEGRIKKNIRCVNDILKKTIVEVELELKKISSEKNMKLIFFDTDIDFSDFSEHLEDPDFFIDKVYSYCKKIFCKNRKIPIIDETFCQNSLMFDGIPCLGLTGEQKEILLKLLNR